MEHLSEEIERLNLRIRLRALKRRDNRTSDPWEQFKGLVLSDVQAAALLGGLRSPLVEPGEIIDEDEERRKLIDALRAMESRIAERRTASQLQGVVLSLPYLSQLCGLTPFEEQCLIVCLAPELDHAYERLYSYLQDDVTRKRPSVDLILNLLCETAAERLTGRLAFDPQAPLQRYRLVQVAVGTSDGPAPLPSQSLKLDDRIVNQLLDVRTIDSRLGPAVRLIHRQRTWDDVVVPAQVRDRVRGVLQSHLSGAEAGPPPLICYVHGPYGSNPQALVEAAGGDLGLPVLVADVPKALSGPLPFGEFAWLLGREALLQQTLLCLDDVDALLGEGEQHDAHLAAVLEAAQSFCPLTFLLGQRSWKPGVRRHQHAVLDVELVVPNEQERKALWDRALLGRAELAPDIDTGVLASTFRLTPGQIRDALGTAAMFASGGAPATRMMTMADLRAACRAQSSPRLATLARKVVLVYEWTDIVLPPDQLAQLCEVCNQAKFRHIVYGEWGFDRKLSLGRGLNVLFSGPPGTGKTMAAEVIAADLGLDLYKIDLSQVVSKYIGETEKNLDKIFAVAQTSSAILFFDEADALFGRRSEVRDAHDRYANIEVGYLLQKMEEYDGIAVLATNLRQHIDDAFLRRLHAIVEFPFPDEGCRRRIWDVVFPRGVPLGDDVDFDALAREVRLAGGNIRNIALTAAFYAANDGRVVRRAHLRLAAHREFQKLGRTWEEGGPGPTRSAADEGGVSG